MPGGSARAAGCPGLLLLSPGGRLAPGNRVSGPGCAGPGLGARWGWEPEPGAPVFAPPPRAALGPGLLTSVGLSRGGAGGGGHGCCCRRRSFGPPPPGVAGGPLRQRLRPVGCLRGRRGGGHSPQPHAAGSFPGASPVGRVLSLPSGPAVSLLLGGGSWFPLRPVPAAGLGLVPL